MALSALASGPGRRQGLVAFAAGHEAAQREVLAHILPDGRFGASARETLLHLAESLPAHQRLVLALAQGHAPFGVLDIARIDLLAQKHEDALVLYDAVFGPGKVRLILKEAHHLGLRIETPGGESFYSLAHEGGHGFMRDEPVLVDGVAFIAIADRRLEDPIAAHHAGTHAVLGLLGVLLAVMLGNTRQHVLDKLAIRILAELDGGRFQRTARRGNRGAQSEMRFQPTGETGNIVDDHDRTFLAVLVQEGQHGVHAGTCRHPAGHIVLEDRHDLIALIGRELAAARLLGVEAAALDLLLGVRNAGIDNGFFFVLCLHRFLFGRIRRFEGGTGADI